jgi:hypothetical protein
MCAHCTDKAINQYRCYIRPGETRVGSIGFSIYLCKIHSRDFENIMEAFNINSDWLVKISMDNYRLHKRVNFHTTSKKS